MDILSVLSQGYTLMTSGADFVEFRIPQERHVFLRKRRFVLRARRALENQQNPFPCAAW